MKSHSPTDPSLKSNREAPKSSRILRINIFIHTSIFSRTNVGSGCTREEHGDGPSRGFAACVVRDFDRATFVQY
jgi:hypothetical protein